jgi:hypothetical protein
MRAAALTDPLHSLTHRLNDITRKKLKTDTDYEKIAEIEYFGSLWVEDGWMVIPGEAIKAVFIRSARTQKIGRVALAGLICPESAKLIYKGSICLDGLWAIPEFRLRTSVRVNISPTIRTRAIIRTRQQTLTYDSAHRF